MLHAPEERESARERARRVRVDRRLFPVVWPITARGLRASLPAAFIITCWRPGSRKCRCPRCSHDSHPDAQGRFLQKCKGPVRVGLRTSRDSEQVGASECCPSISKENIPVWTSVHWHNVFACLHICSPASSASPCCEFLLRLNKVPICLIYLLVFYFQIFCFIFSNRIDWLWLL